MKFYEAHLTRELTRADVSQWDGLAPVFGTRNLRFAAGGTFAAGEPCRVLGGGPIARPWLAVFADGSILELTTRGARAALATERVAGRPVRAAGAALAEARRHHADLQESRRMAGAYSGD